MLNEKLIRKVLILGHGRHGKDTVAEMMHEMYGIVFKSSSWAAAEIFIYNQLRAWGYDYSSFEECYEDRHDHRALWKSLITKYNARDRARLCREILRTNDCYVGMRCELEYAASRHMFTHVVWVDALKRLPEDPTMTISRDPSMIVIDNNGTLKHLEQQVKDLFPHE